MGVKKFIINWLNKCPKCEAKDADVLTEKGHWASLWPYDSVTCRKCGHKGEIETLEGHAFCIWDDVELFTHHH